MEDIFSDPRRLNPDQLQKELRIIAERISADVFNLKTEKRLSYLRSLEWQILMIKEKRTQRIMCKNHETLDNLANRAEVLRRNKLSFHPSKLLAKECPKIYARGVEEVKSKNAWYIKNQIIIARGKKKVETRSGKSLAYSNWYSAAKTLGLWKLDDRAKNDRKS